MDRIQHHDGACGASLLELMLAVLLLVTGLLGFASSMVSGQAMRRTTGEMADANKEVANLIEQFRFECDQGFDAAVAKYMGATFEGNRLPGNGPTGGAVIKTNIILDENKLDPRMDIDGNGNENDSSVAAASLQMAVLSVRITWNVVGGSEYSQRSVAYVARGEASAAGAGKKSETEPSSASITLEAGSLIQSNALTATINTDTDLQVVGVTVNTTKSAFLKEIAFTGDKVFSMKSGLPATGTKVTTAPFTVPANTASLFNNFTFAGSSDGSGVPNMGKSTITVRLHLESGQSVLFSVDV